MHDLVVPDALAGLGVEADERVGEEIVAVTMAAVEIARRRLDRADRRSRARHRAENGVHTPGVARVLPAVVVPGVDAELAVPAGRCGRST